MSIVVKDKFGVERDLKKIIDKSLYICGFRYGEALNIYSEVERILNHESREMKIRTLECGDEFVYCDNEWIVIGTCMIGKYAISKSALAVYMINSTDDWETSKIRKILNKKFSRGFGKDRKTYIGKDINMKIPVQDLEEFTTEKKTLCGETYGNNKVKDYVSLITYSDFASSCRYYVMKANILGNMMTATKYSMIGGYVGIDKFGVINEIECGKSCEIFPVILIKNEVSVRVYDHENN